MLLNKQFQKMNFFLYLLLFGFSLYIIYLKSSDYHIWKLQGNSILGPSIALDIFPEIFLSNDEDIKLPLADAQRNFLHSSGVDLPWWDSGECLNKTNIVYTGEVQGHCGRRASAVGKGQKVISICLFGKKTLYYKGLEETLNIMNEVYPGYVLRLYVNPRLYKEYICPLLWKYNHFFVCDISDLPSGLGNIENIHPKGWRFAPMGDPQVDVILVRDSDSTILEREAKAVQDWLGSKTTLHVMKDVPRSGKGHPIMGGCWGVRSDQGKMNSMGIGMSEKLNIIRELLFDYLKNKTGYYHDQDALRDIVYPILRNDMVRHDSYYCQQYPGSRPFPTQRNDTTSYVGQRWYHSSSPPPRKNMKCPKVCRPTNHQDWEYC